MNAIHTAILGYIRDSQIDPLLTTFMAMDDVQIVYRMFSSHRGARGMKLTKLGLEIMQKHFRSYEVKLPKDEVSNPSHLVFLDSKSRLPYYCDKERIVVFDGELGVKLQLVDGRISALIAVGTD